VGWKMLHPATLNPEVKHNEGPMGSSIFGSANPANAGLAMPLNSDLRTDRVGMSRVRVGGHLS
jgi:hypothetical protein